VALDKDMPQYADFMGSDAGKVVYEMRRGCEIEVDTLVEQRLGFVADLARQASKEGAA